MNALVTGASRGIGRAVAAALAQKGVNIAINYSGSHQAAEETLALCEAAGVRAVLVRGDVSSLTACREIAGKTQEALGDINILVNNAGITRDGLLLRMKEEAFDEVYAVCLKSVYNLCSLVIGPMMKRRFGRIINISSVSGLYGNLGQTNYSAMKAGVIGFTKALAKEAGARGVTVNTVAPGFINTDMTRVLSKEIQEAALSKIALRRFGEPEEIAGAVAFLASEDAAYITGQTIEISGGIEL